VIVTRSVFGHAETVRRLLEAIERRRLRLFARVDHAAAAREAGVELPDEEVLLFGNPAVGTPLMLADPRIGIELPLRMVVWRDGDRTLLGHRDPRELADEYEVGAHRPALDGMATRLGDLAAEAAGQQSPL
jgi:uncharacterized protein (DUF302 family)